MRRLLLVLGLIAVAACGTSNGAAGTVVPASLATSTIGIWNLDSGTDGGADIPILDTNPITMSLNGAQIVGRAACNTYSGRYTINPDGHFTIVDGVAVTEMWCDPAEVNESERAYLDALQKVNHAERTDSGLVLKGDGVELRYILDDEAGTPPPSDPTDDPDEPVSSGRPFPTAAYGDWTLVSGESNGSEIPMVDSHPVTMTISEQEGGGQIAGGRICNSWGTMFDDDGRPADGAQTLMACLDEGVMESEAAFLDALQRMERAELVGDNLVVRGTDLILTFERR